ncbi:MAG: hypothetical protein IJI57_13140 [Flexilinea sp.]|nr:hypothetical protein [Flexilinea sp.]
MQLALLFVLSFCCCLAVVVGTQQFRTEKRTFRVNLLLFAAGLIVCFAFSVLVDCIIKAGPPTFFYHTHKPGMTTLKIFGTSCLSGSSFYALFLMLAERKNQHSTILRWLFRSFLIGMCGAFILEIGYFNFRHFELIGAKAPEKTFLGENIYCSGIYFNRAAWKFIPYQDDNPEFFVYANYSKVRNLSVEFGKENPLERVEVKFDDRAHRRLESIGEHSFIPEIPRSYTIPLHTVGNTYLLSMLIADSDEHWKDGVELSRVTLNSVVPLELDPLRFFLSFLVTFLLSAFFPGSPLWSLKLDFHSFPQMAAVFALIGMVILFFFWTVFSSYSDSDQVISEQKAALTENFTQYNKLVDALLARRYALLETPHHYLEKDGDPYDMKLREERKYDYPWDTAYYQGKYYVYFGAVPAVTVLLPYKLLTGTYLELDYPILGFSILFLIGIYGVYSRIVKSCFPKISFALYWTGLLILYTSLNLTWCLRRTLIYELAITSGICFAVWGIYFMLAAVDSVKMKPFCFLLSGACSALAVGCRPTMIFVSIPVFLLGFFALKADNGKVRLRNLFLFLFPYILAGVALMKYNYERFDDPFEFGITWQLTTENRATGLPLLGPWGRTLSILASLFTFPNVDMEFPFIHPQRPALTYNGVILNSDVVTGLFAYPIMTVLLFLPAVRKDMLKSAGFLFPFCFSCLLAAAGICVTASGFAITNRYLTDYLFLAILPALFVFFCIWQHLETAGWQKAGAGITLFCAVIGVGLSLSLALTGEEDWFRRIAPLCFEKLRYAFSPWL